MTTINSLYELFTSSPDCTDDELRRAYHRAMLQHHPDKNPDQVEAATIKTQRLTVAYADLKEYRRTGIPPNSLYTEDDWSTKVVDFAITLQSTFNQVDIEDITHRKQAFRNAWEAFRLRPTDVFLALQLVHASFNAERQDTIFGLLQNSVLIDAASLLISQVDSESACVTLIRWADFLYEDHLVKESIQILEDVLATGNATSDVKEHLRRKHYYFAQGYTSKDKKKPVPAVRIKHLNRILELGFEYDYIYKQLAEAYYDLNNNAQARTHLKRAYEINPDLSGAVRISRALGFQDKKAEPSKTKKRKRYQFARPEQIPPPSQIRKWAANGDWDEIFPFAESDRYSPHIRSKTRNTLRQIASSLGSCPDSQAVEALKNLLNSVYWDVREASILSLAKVGDQHTIHLLQNLPSDNSRLETCRKNVISYLRARTTIHLPIGPPNVELFELARETFDMDNYGKARFLLENILAMIEQGHSSYLNVLTLLARSCAEMGDSNEAINLIKPVLAELPTKSRRQMSKYIASWLWEQLVFEAYDSANDEDYLLVLDIHINHALTSNNPDEVLGNLRHLTRWLEILGEGKTAQWIRSLIRTEAPGTWYVDSHDRHQYVHQVELSENLKSQLIAVNDRIRTGIPDKLSQVLQSPNVLEGSDYLLTDR